MKRYLARRAGEGAQSVPMFRARRRVQALQRMGWNVERIALLAGIRPGTLRNLDARNRMHLNLFKRLAAVYENLQYMDGPSLIAQGLAVKAGFAPPAAWDNIDDPREQPKGVLHV